MSQGKWDFEEALVNQLIDIEAELKGIRLELIELTKALREGQK